MRNTGALVSLDTFPHAAPTTVHYKTNAASKINTIHEVQLQAVQAYPFSIQVQDASKVLFSPERNVERKWNLQR